MVDQNTKANEHIFYEMNRTVYFVLIWSANKTQPFPLLL